MLWISKAKDDDIVGWQKNKLKIKKIGGSTKNENKYKKLTLNAILLAMGLLIHQITPAIGLPMKPDVPLAMLFVILVLNRDDYKTCLIAGIVTGIFTALTSSFPGGQIPNVIDKTLTANIVFLLMNISYNMPFIKN